MPPVWRESSSLWASALVACRNRDCPRFVDANAPQNDRRMVPVATDHAARRCRREISASPRRRCAASRESLPEPAAQFIASVEKMPRLRIVRRAHDVAFEFLAQDSRIAPLHARRHCLTDEGKGLMPVEPAQLDDFAVQRKPCSVKLRRGIRWCERLVQTFFRA